MRRQQSEIDRLKNRNRTLEDDMRKLATDAARPNASVSVDARAASMYDRSAGNTVKNAGVNSVAVSTRSLDQRALMDEKQRQEAIVKHHEDEVKALNSKIREMEFELKQQKDQYLRKSSTKAVP